MTTRRITWGAVAMHAIVAACVVLIAENLAAKPGAAIAAVALSLIYPAREVWTAARRHETTLADGVQILLRGEPGWSRWNLRLQAFVPVAAAWLLTLHVLAID